MYEYEPFALIVTDAPLGSACVRVPVPLSATTVLVSPGSTSVSFASTPGAATFSVVSSSAVPTSSTAVGGSLAGVTAIARVSEPGSAVLSVTVNVAVRVKVDGASELLKYVTSRSADWYAAGDAAPDSVIVSPTTIATIGACASGLWRARARPARPRGCR